MNRFSLASLRVRLVLLVLLALLPAFGLAVYSDIEQRRLATQRAQDNALHLAHIAAADQSALIAAAHQLLIALAQLPQARSRDAAACNLLMSNLLKQYPVYANLGVADSDGNIICSGVPFQSPVNIVDRDYFQQTLQTRDFAIGEYQIERITRLPGLGMGFPVSDENGRGSAVVFASLNLTWLNQLASDAQLPPGSTLGVTDRNNVILAHYPEPEKWVGTIFPGALLSQVMNSQRGEGTFEASGVDGVARLYASVPLHYTAGTPEVYVTVGVPSAVAFAEANATLVRDLAGLGLAAALAVVAAWFFGDLFIVRRASALAGAAEQLTAGNLSARTGRPYGNDELDQLARRFDGMAATLQEREGTLRKWADIFQSTRIGLAMSSPDGESLLLMNPAFAAMHGYAVDELVGKPFRDLVPPEDRQKLPELFRAIRAERHQILEVKGVRKDGTVFPSLIDATVVKDAKDEIEYLIASVQDIGELRRAETGEREQRALAEALRDTAAALNSTLNFDDVLDRILDSVWRVVPHDTANIMLIESEVARVVRSRGYAERDLESWLLAQRFPLAKHARLQWMVETGQPHLIADTGNFSGWVNFPETRWIRSVIGVPLRVRARVVGFLNLDSATPNFFKAAHIARLETFADQTAIALENARLLAETEQRANEFTALYKVARDLTTPRDLPTLLQTIVDHAIELLDAPCGYIYLYDATQDDLELAVEVGVDVPVGARLQMGEGMAGQVARDRQPLIVDDYSAWEYRSARYEGVPYRATVEVPMLYGGDVIGVLGVSEVGATTRKFTETDVGLLTLFAGQAAGTVLNARLLAETERRASEFAALYDIERDLATQRDLPALLQTIADRAMSLLAASTAGLYLFDAAQGDLELSSFGNLPVPTGMRLKLGEGMAGRVAQSRQPMIVADYASWEHRSPKFEGVPITSVVEVPLLYGGELIGVLAVNGAPERKFTDADVRLLSLFGGQAASAVYNARLLDETRARAEQLALLYDAGLTLNSVLDPRVQLEFLLKIATRALNAERAEFFRFDASANQLRLEMNVGYADENVKQSVSRLCFSTEDERGIVNWVAEQRLPLRLGDVQADPRWIVVDPDIRSGIWAPVQHESQLRGVLGVLSTRLNAFTAPDERLLVLFANQVATAMENARLFDEARRRADRLAVLNRIASVVSQTLNLDELLEVIYQEVTATFKTDACFIALYDAARDELDYRIQVDQGVRAAPRRQSLTAGFSAEVIKTQKPLLIRDWEKERDHLPQPILWGSMKPSRSWLGVPMRSDNQVVGIVTVETYDPDMYDEEDEHLLATIADQVALVIQNARLFDETRQRLIELEAVSRISTALRAAQTIGEMVPLLLDEMLAVLATSAGQIAFYDARSNEMRVAAARGWFVNTPQDAPANDGIAGEVIRTGQPYVTREFKPDKTTSDLARAQIPDGWGGALVPIRIAQEVIGVFAASVKLPRELTSAEIRLLTTLAEIAGNAIHRATLHEQTEQRLQRLDALHVIDTAIGASLDLRVTMNVLLDQVITQLRVDAADILLLNPHFQMLEYTAGRGFRSAAIERTRVRMGQDYAGRAAMERRMIHVPDLSAAGAEINCTELMKAEGFIAYYAAPLIAKGQIQGVLEIFHRSRLAPDAEWLDFVGTLAGQAAIAVDNATLFDGLQRSNFDIALAYDATIEGWSRSLDLREHAPRGRTPRVMQMTLRLAQAMGMSNADLVHVRRGAQLHDLGKLGIPDSVLLKREPLTAEEEEIMRRHPVLAHELLSSIAYLRPAIDIPYCHHENWDGTGYPRGIQGDQIPVAARCFAVAELWDELRTDQPGRAALTIDQAREHLRAQAGTRLDPRAVEVFLSSIEQDSD